MIKRFEIIEQNIGQGGYGKIDKAKDNTLERYVAIKTLDPIFKLEPSQEDKLRFLREAKTLAKFSHTNIPAIYDIIFDEVEKKFQIIFEWIDGINVNKYLREKGTISLLNARKWLLNICSALHHSHNVGIIHRDIKPSNLIITNCQESCFLVDFGIALNKAEIERLTAGTPIGTQGYMSPEHERGEKLGHESDIFSLGIVLYEMLSGFKPNIGEYKALNSINEAIPPLVDQLIKDSILSDRTKRIQSATEFSERLVNALRPHSSFAATLSSGALYEINANLSQMDSETYGNLPVGQRTLIITRIKDLVNVNQNHLRKATASVLAQLVKLGHSLSDKNYEWIIEKSLYYGFNIQYGEHWFGNEEIRENLGNVSLLCGSDAHNIISKKTIDFIKTMEDFNQKEKWYYHDFRIILQNLLANPHCLEQHALSIGEILENVNILSHKTGT